MSIVSARIGEAFQSHVVARFVKLQKVRYERSEADSKGFVPTAERPDRSGKANDEALEAWNGRPSF
jgi:hypothetical protein